MGLEKMNANPYSYDEILNIIDLCVGIELHTRTEPESHHIRLLGIGITRKLLEMNHGERITMIKEVIQYL